MGFFTPRSKEFTMTWCKRVLLVVLIIGALFYGVLKVAERSTDSMRLGIQDYLSSATKNPAEVTELTTVQLIPEVVFRMGGVSILDKDDPKKALAKAEKAYFAIPLWKLFLGQKDYIGMEIQGLEFSGGYVLPKKLDLGFLGISDPSPEKGGTPSMIADGHYNGLPLLITGEMTRHAAKKYYLYEFASAFPFTFKLGQTEADGLFTQGFNSISLKQVQLIRGDERAEFVLRDFKPNPVSGTIEGTINDQPFNGSLTTNGDNITLAIVPGPDADIAKIRTLVGKIEKDIGLKKDDRLQVEIRDASGKEELNKKETDQKE